MGVEKILSEKGVAYFSSPKTNTECLKFYFEHKYWYEGRLFLIGHFNNDSIIKMIEAETGATAIFANDGKPSNKKIIEEFKRRLKSSGKTIHEVIRDFKNNNNLNGIWLINLLDS